MNGTKLIERIRLKNILSFGSEGQDIALEPLNVLIGPNGSGKSNLIEVIDLLHSAPMDLTIPIRSGGGIGEWLWKGNKVVSPAEVEIVMRVQEDLPLRYRLQFSSPSYYPYGQYFQIDDEVIELDQNASGQPYDVFFYRYRQGNPVLNARVDMNAPIGNPKGRTWQELSSEQLDITKSVLSQAISMPVYPEITLLSVLVERFRFYRGFNVGRHTPPRQPQQADLPNDFLLEDGSNLGLVLNKLEVIGLRRRIVDTLQRFYESVDDFTVSVEGGSVQFFLREQGLQHPVSATRLSDGTIRFLCLLAVLLHPTPQPLVCIEEPEIGLHPDAMPLIAELLIEASQRTQLIVTTHSEALVSALSQTPEAIIVCERDQDGTKLRRLEAGRLKEWLERYTLGDLWQMGEIGGTRW